MKRNRLEPLLREVEQHFVTRVVGRAESITTTRALATWFLALVQSELEKSLEGLHTEGETVAEAVARRVIAEALHGSDPMTAAQLIVGFTEVAPSKERIQ